MYAKHKTEIVLTRTEGPKVDVEGRYISHPMALFVILNLVLGSNQYW